MALEFEHGWTVGLVPSPMCIVLYSFNVGRFRMLISRDFSLDISTREMRLGNLKQPTEGRGVILRTISRRWLFGNADGVNY